MVEVNVDLFIKSMFRVLPLFFIPQPALDLKISPTIKLLISIGLALVMSEHLRLSAVGHVGWGYDLGLGLIVALLAALFLHGAQQITSLFFVEEEETISSVEQKNVIDAVWSAILLIAFFSLRLEQTFLELLGGNHFVPAQEERIWTFAFWARALKDVTLLGTKIASFGFVVVLSKKLVEEIFRKLGGDSMRAVFSFLFWINLVLLSPLFMPSLSDMMKSSMGTMWHSWFGSLR